MFWKVFRNGQKKNPELASGLTLIIMAITGLIGVFLVLVPIIASVGGLFATLGTPLLVVVGIVALVVAVSLGFVERINDRRKLYLCYN